MIRFCAEKLTAAWAVLSKGWLRTGGTLREVGAVVVIVAASLAWRLLSGGVEADAAPKAPRKAPQQTAAPVAQPAEERLVAMVNGAEISQGQLAAECLSRHGTAVLETLVNKQIISQACQRQGIAVTPQDVDAEIDAMSRRFNVPRDKWIELIQQERGITSAQYAEEIVWPMIALRRLARAGIEPTPEEITKAFDNQFGPAVKARIIVVRSPAEAEKLRAQVLAAPDDFGALARQHSIDVGSASANGWVQPVRRHSGEPQFEAAVFGLEPGGISTVVQVADQFIVVKCEGHLPAAEVKLDDVRPRLAEELRERKSRAASSDVFRQLQDAAIVENIFNDPAKSAAQPGVAALVNGQPIAIDQVRDECLERHGNDVLEILVTRTILQQALEREKRQVSQAEVDAEITTAAERLGFRKPDGSADTAAWIERVTREQKLPVRHYVEDIVQPTVALKKLVGQVAVTQEDLDKAFAATFGPRARCRVIILDNQRRAQEVWQLARQSPTVERLGELAEQYSVDPASRALRGEVPPIQRHGGQPALEREAFSLKPGELSGVLQVADRFIVLFCEGYDDIFEKKQRIEMARFFSHLREGATIDNFLAGTSQSPKPGGPARTSTVPKTSLTKSETEELAQPRAGSRRAAAAVPPAAGSGVVPASLDTPSGDR